MAQPTKFFKTTMTVEVLWCNDLDPLDDISEVVNREDVLFRTIDAKHAEITPQEMVQLTYEHASSPDFFSLDDDGSTIDYEAEEELTPEQFEKLVKERWILGPDYTQNPPAKDNQS